VKPKALENLPLPNWFFPPGGKSPFLLFGKNNGPSSPEWEFNPFAFPGNLKTCLQVKKPSLAKIPGNPANKDLSPFQLKLLEICSGVCSSSSMSILYFWQEL